MLPMGWNQIRQARVPGMQQQPQLHMNFDHQPQMMMPNQQPFQMYQQPHMMHPQHQQMFPPPMMGGYAMQKPQMMMQNPLKPPEPEGPPPPSPPAPLPSNEALPPPPPDEEQEWWLEEMKKLPNVTQRQELQHLVNEKWFHDMPPNHQIDCWKRKLDMINTQHKDTGDGQQMTPVISAPAVSAPPRLKSQFLQTGDIDTDLRKAKEEEGNIRQQVVTFEKQYGEWKKQFDDWKEKHKGHPNKEQFSQYEKQWMTWQKQMSDQKSEYDNNLASIQEKIRNIEHQKAGMQNQAYNEQPGPGLQSGFQGPRAMHGNQQQPQRFPPNHNQQPQFPFNSGPRANFDINQSNHFEQDLNNEQGFNPNQDEQYTNLAQPQGKRFPPPRFDNQQRPRFSQRLMRMAGMGDSSFQPPSPANFEEGPRPRFNGPRRGGPRFSKQWQQSGNRFRGPTGPRFRNTTPQEEDFGEDWGEEEEYHNEEDEQFQPSFGQNQMTRGPRPAFGFRGRGMRGGPRNRFDGPRQRPPRFAGAGEGIGVTGQKQRPPRPAGAGEGFGVRGPRQRPPRPTGVGEGFGVRGPRPRFPGQQGRFPGPRGPRPLLNLPTERDQFTEDDTIPDNNFYVDNGAIAQEEETMKVANADAEEGDDNNEGPDWNMSRDIVPPTFGKHDKRRRVSRDNSFCAQDVKKANVKKEADNPEEEKVRKEAKNVIVQQEKDVPNKVKPEDDYSHYMTDEYAAFDDKPKPRARGLLDTPSHARGRGRSAPMRGQGRGATNRGRGRDSDYAEDFPQEDVRKPSHMLMNKATNRGRGRGRDYAEDFPQEDIPKPPHMLIKKEEKFNKDSMGRSQPEEAMVGRIPESTASDPSRNSQASSYQRMSTTSPSSSSIDANTVLQKAKELSTLDIKNLLSAVKSLKSTSLIEEDQNSGVEHRDQDLTLSAGDNSQVEDVEAAWVARERHYDQLARDFDDPALRHRGGRSLNPGGRLTEADLMAAGLDPISLGLRNEDLLMQDYLLNPTLMEPPLRDPVMRDPLLDPLLQETFLERELLIQEMREMREREAVREREAARRELELRQALAKPILQAQKIVETIDYSHGLNKKDNDKRDQEENRDIVRRQTPTIVDYGGPSHGVPPYRDSPYQDRPESEVFDHERRRFPPISMDERMRMREHGIPPPGVDVRMVRERGFPIEMDQRIVQEREWPRNPPQMERHRSPYNPDSSIVVAEDVIHEGEALQKHWQKLEQERESMERRRISMERRRNSLERTRASKEREEERRERERSLERLRNMERELKERERMLNERERRLKTPPRSSRDKRDRDDWKIEGSRDRTSRRSRTPPRRRFEEERPSRPNRDGDRERRRRSPSPARGRDWDDGKPRGRSPQWNQREPIRDRSPRNRNRSPNYMKNRPMEVRDRRRFTSPSGNPSKTRSPVGMRTPVPRVVKVEPVFVRVEDLLNDPARQQRPKRIVIILRGLPGSGKSHIAKLIRDRESAKGVTPRLLGLDDYFMVENEKFEKDADTGRIVKRKVHEYEYEAAMEPSYRDSLLKSFKKTLEDGYFSFVIVDSINDKASYFSEFWTAAKKCVFEVYVAELTADVHVCAKRNLHKRQLPEIQDIAKGWEQTPAHMIRLDVRQMLQDSEIQEVEMGDISDDDAVGDPKKDQMTPEQLAGVPQSKWELIEANERLDKLDGIKKKRLTSSQQDMAEFLSVTDDYVQRASAPGKKRVRWADIEEKSTQRRLREVGFVVGNTDWSRLVDGDTHADAALNRTKFI